MSDDKNLHKGHRQRMLKKYLEHGIDCFEEHEILEILLFSAYTRRNTNDISHKLIAKFGSLEAVLTATPEELEKVEDVGPTAAALICFFSDFARHFNTNKIPAVVLANTDESCRYCYNLLKDTKKEVAYVLFLDDTNHLISSVEYSNNSVDDVTFDLKSIISKALKTDCRKVILTHSHPDGALLPSNADISATRKIANSFANIEVMLVDHIIVNSQESFSMRAGGFLSEIW